jgi:tol-pal system protein YbgF
MIRRMAIACVFAVLATGCATRGAVYQTAEDLRALQSEVGALRQSQEDLSRRLNEMTSANRAANARAEQLQASIAAVKADVERLTTRVQATEGAVKAVNEAVARSTAAPAAAPAPPPPASPRPAPDPPKSKGIGSAESAFAAGLSNFRNREYGQAVLDFLDVVTKHPSHELASTSQFWIGEAYYLQHDYRQALSEFERAIEWPAPNPKVADALLKAGVCYSHLREPTQARHAWRRVVREFPDSPAAAEARILLDGRKSPASSARRP